MTLYLSRLSLSRAPGPAALNSILSPDAPGPRLDAHHRLLWAAFSDGPDRRRDFLWREDRPGEFLTLSARPPNASDLFAPPQVKPFAPALEPGSALDFSLRANATMSRKGVGRVDVVMDALRAVPKGERGPERMATAGRAGAGWLARQGAKAGFRVDRVEVVDYRTIVLPGHRGPRQDQPQFGILDMTGRITVSDPGAFLAQLVQGFGRAKSYGCGLMLIRRAG